MSSYNDKNYDENSVGEKLKRLFRNRAVVITAVTLLLVFSIIIAVTVSANRAKQNPGGGLEGNGTDSSTESQTTRTDIGKETLPTYQDQETEPVVNNKPATSTYVLPVSGKLFKDHDPTMQVYSNTMGDYRVHLGVDITTEVNAPVCAVADGKVAKVWSDSLMGVCVAVSHDGEVMSVYKNLAKTLAEGVEAGATIKAGQQLGTVGDTAILEMADGPHLHFEMTVGGLSADPLDYFSKESVKTWAEDTAFEVGAETTDSASEE